MATEAEQEKRSHDATSIPPAQDERDPPVEMTPMGVKPEAPETSRATGTDGKIVPFPGSRKASNPVTVKPKKSATSGKALTVQGISKKRRRKPPKQRGYYWRQDSVGFELRRSKDHAYVARLSGKQWDAMKREHKGAALVAVVNQWAAQKIAKKGM